MLGYDLPEEMLQGHVMISLRQLFLSSIKGFEVLVSVLLEYTGNSMSFLYLSRIPSQSVT